MLPKINVPSIVIGVALGYFVAPRIIGPVLGKVSELTGKGDKA